MLHHTTDSNTQYTWDQLSNHQFYLWGLFVRIEYANFKDGVHDMTNGTATLDDFPDGKSSAATLRSYLLFFKNAQACTNWGSELK